MKTSTDTISFAPTQALSSLMRSSLIIKNDESWAKIFARMISNSDSIEPPPAASRFLLTPDSYINHSGGKGYSAAGRNMALADPESAYNMMTAINNRDVAYKAQFAELHQVKSDVVQMQDAGRSLGMIGISASNDIIRSGLQDFVGQYNIWIQRINPDIRLGGLLADTQAARASQFELEQNFNNPVFGGTDGVHGLRDLGVTIESDTRLALLDTAKLDALLAANKQGVVDTVQEFSANFSQAASLLNSDGNFILKQLDNLKRAIHYIAENKVSLQEEFGMGDAAKPMGQVAEALAVYNQCYALSN